MGGLFLLGKATYEIHDQLEGAEHSATRKAASFASVIAQIVVLDIVIVAMIIMLVSAKPISEFVNRHPTVKMLALSFLLLIGASLIADGFDQHIPKGYVYGPIAFSIFVEFLNLRARSKRAQEPVHLLHPSYVKTDEAADRS